MKTNIKKVPKLTLENGKLKGGFVAINEDQQSSIKGGYAPPIDSNDHCHNMTSCDGDNNACTNDKWCD